MLTVEERKALIERVRLAYLDKYPDIEDFKVTEITENRYFGILASVEYRDNPGGEVCLCDRGGINIFDTTPELVRRLDMRASQVISLKEILGAAATVVILLLFATIVLTDNSKEATQLVITAASSILGLYVGKGISEKGNPA